MSNPIDNNNSFNSSDEVLDQLNQEPVLRRKNPEHLPILPYKQRRKPLPFRRAAADDGVPQIVIDVSKLDDDQRDDSSSDAAEYLSSPRVRRSSVIALSQIVAWPDTLINSRVLPVKIHLSVLLSKNYCFNIQNDQLSVRYKLSQLANSGSGAETRKKIDVSDCGDGHIIGEVYIEVAKDTFIRTPVLKYEYVVSSQDSENYPERSFVGKSFWRTIKYSGAENVVAGANALPDIVIRRFDIAFADQQNAQARGFLSPDSDRNFLISETLYALSVLLPNFASRTNDTLNSSGHLHNSAITANKSNNFLQRAAEVPLSDVFIATRNCLRDIVEHCKRLDIKAQRTLYEPLQRYITEQAKHLWTNSVELQRDRLDDAVHFYEALLTLLSLCNTFDLKKSLQQIGAGPRTSSHLSLAKFIRLFAYLPLQPQDMDVAEYNQYLRCWYAPFASELPGLLSRAARICAFEMPEKQRYYGLYFYPAYHLFSQAIVPYVTPPRTVRHNENWWAMDARTKDVIKYLKSAFDSMPVFSATNLYETVFDQTKHLFDMDPFWQRKFLYLLKDELLLAYVSLEVFTIENLVARCSVRMKNALSRYLDTGKYVPLIRDELRQIARRLPQYKERGEVSLPSLKPFGNLHNAADTSLDMASTLFDYALNSVLHSIGGLFETAYTSELFELTEYVFSIAYSLIGHYLFTTTTYDNQLNTRAQQLSDSIYAFVWRSLVPFFNSLEKDVIDYKSVILLVKLTKLVKTLTPKREMVSVWLDVLRSAFQNSLNRRRALQKLQLYCHLEEVINWVKKVTGETIPADILGIIRSLAFLEVDTGKTDILRLSSVIFASPNRYFELLAHFIDQTLPNMDKIDRLTLLYALTNHTFHDLLGRLYECASHLPKLSQISPQCVERLNNFVQEIEPISLESLVQGNVTLKNLEMIVNFEEDYVTCAIAVAQYASVAQTVDLGNTQLVGTLSRRPSCHIPTESQVREIVQTRNQEGRYFLKVLKMVQNLVRVFDTYSELVPILKGKTRIDPERIKLKDVIRVQPQYQPNANLQLSYLSIDEPTMQLLSAYNALIDSHMLRTMIVQTLQGIYAYADATKTPVELDHDHSDCLSTQECISKELQLAVAFVRPCIVCTANRYEAIQNGTITVRELHDTVSRIFGDHLDCFERELRYLDNHRTALDTARLSAENVHAQGGASQGLTAPPAPDWLEVRIRQCFVLRKTDNLMSICRFVNALKENCGLTGDFSVVERVTRIETLDSRQLNSFDTDTLQDFEHLLDVAIKEQELQALRIFIEPEVTEFVRWMRENVPTATEFGTLLEMAAAKAHDDDRTETCARMYCFEQAVNGYQSLIYLPKHSGLSEVIGAFRIVLINLSTDRRLPAQLQDSARSVEWLKSIQKEHNSVEQSVSQQLAAFERSHSEFRIGLPQTHPKNSFSVADLLQCSVYETSTPTAESEVEEPRRSKYTLEQLRIMRIKAALISRMSDIRRNVDKAESEQLLIWFANLVDSLENLIHRLFLLLNEGASVFRHFAVGIVINSGEFTVSVTSEHPAMPLQLRVESQTPESIIIQLDNISRSLRSCLQTWQKHVNALRFRYPEVNVFTNQQLAALADSLNPLWLHVQRDGDCDADIGELQMVDASSTICTISAGFRMVCNVQLLIATLRKIRVTRQAQTETTQDRHNERVSKCTAEELTDLVTSSWVDCLKRECYPELLNSVTLCAGLRTLLETANEENLRPRLVRNLPESYSSETVNLLVCYQEMQMIKLVLSIYHCATTDNGSRVMPTAEEMLFCTQETSSEQIELLMKRASLSVNGSDQPLYCLAFTPTANAELVRTTIDSYNQLAQHSSRRKSLNLFVVCLQNLAGSLSTGLGVAPVAIERFLQVDDRVIKTAVKQQLEYENYLKNFPKARSFKVAAPNCEAEQTVRVVESNFAGSGKTSYIQGRIEAFRRQNLRLSSADQGAERDSQGRLKSYPPIVISLYHRVASTDELFHYLPADHTCSLFSGSPRIYHIDVVNTNKGFEYILFNLLILGVLTDSNGVTWLRSPFDLYLIEHTTRFVRVSDEEAFELAPISSLLSLLPSILCNSPAECAYWLERPGTPLISMQLVDHNLFRSQIYQLPFEQLRKIDEHENGGRKSLESHGNNVLLFLQIVKSYWGENNPTWYEVRNFFLFLHTQLECFEQNDFVRDFDQRCPGFRDFILRYIVAMSREFATRSLDISEDTARAGGLSALINMANMKDAKNLIRQYQIRRTWDVNQHPYVFFNADNKTVTFFDFQIPPRRYTKLDKTQDVAVEIENGIPGIRLTYKIYAALQEKKVAFNASFDKFPVQAKLAKLIMLWRIFGVDYRKPLATVEHVRFSFVLDKLEQNPEYPDFKSADYELIEQVTQILDPDLTYELTMDNTRKILAIYMRLRSRVPVIVMGETGCGKTAMIEYLSRLTAMNDKVRNLIAVKIHGGINESDIERIVSRAEKLATRNFDENAVETILFFDEANSSEVIHMIKELVCDNRIRSRALNPHLRIFCAVNPYRQHKQSVIDRLEIAGLGYHRGANGTLDSFGPIPMRHLVYRVHPLPQSLLPFVWDFGRLDEATELLYIRRIAKRSLEQVAKSRDITLPDEIVNAICRLVNFCQRFVNEQTDESSFVSLRNVVRVFKVFAWMLQHSQFLYSAMDKKLQKYWRNKVDGLAYSPLNTVLRSTVLTIMICYYVSLQISRDRFYRKFAEELASAYPAVNADAINGRRVLIEFQTLQDVVMEQCSIGPCIAPNGALKENVLLMIICIDLRIPIFIVGKPGTSKSLSREIVRTAMQGRHSTSPFFASLKKAIFVNLQCNHSTTAESITNVFRQCARMQKQKPLDAYVCVAVLDELGLVEDSPHLPLKTLHALLDDGCNADDEETEEDNFDIPDYRRVAFVGLSNWSVDPAKTNRGILVQRAKYDINELELTAEGLCRSGSDGDTFVLGCVQQYLRNLCKAYLEVYDKMRDDFFGLRDFYALITMLVRQLADEHSRNGDYYASQLRWKHVRYAVLRNFDAAATHNKVQPLTIFASFLRTSLSNHAYDRDDDASDDAVDQIINQVLVENTAPGGQSVELVPGVESSRTLNRYPLFIVDDECSTYVLINWLKERGVEIIFGSAFADDRGSYSRLCRDIYKIKMCIELGRPCALMNVPELYDCLYDALNQSFSYLGGDRYVDLSLSGHRMKCKLHERFRLIVIATRSDAAQFPIPLLNRLEKHRFRLSAILTENQREQVDDLRTWLLKFAGLKRQLCYSTDVQIDGAPAPEYPPYKIDEVFAGLDESMLPAVVLANSLEENSTVWQCARLVLDCATAESVIRYSQLNRKDLEESQESARLLQAVEDLFWGEQGHSSVVDLISKHFLHEKWRRKFLHVSTFSRLLGPSQALALQSALEKSLERKLRVIVASPAHFSTLASFENFIQSSFESTSDADASSFTLLLLQCEHSADAESLIFCSLQAVESCLTQLNRDDIGVAFITKISATDKYRSFRFGLWRSTHLESVVRSPDIDWKALRLQTKLLRAALNANNIRSMPLTESILNSVLHSMSDGYTEARLDHMLLDLSQLVKMMGSVTVLPNEGIVAIMSSRFRMDAGNWQHSSLALPHVTFSYLEAVWSVLLFLKARLQSESFHQRWPSQVSADPSPQQIISLRRTLGSNATAVLFIIFDVFLDHLLALESNFKFQDGNESKLLLDCLKQNCERKYSFSESMSSCSFYVKVWKLFNDQARVCVCGQHPCCEANATVDVNQDFDQEENHDQCLQTEFAGSVYKLLEEYELATHSRISDFIQD